MASRMPRLLFFDRFRKKLTVIGMIGHTHGVQRASSPPAKPRRKSGKAPVEVSLPISPEGDEKLLLLLEPIESVWLL